jgi:hypothetical protein
MTSKVVVFGSKMIESGDKGISVGEGTTLLCSNSQFLRCQIGVEGKDSSQAFVYNSLFENNGIAVNAYRKNWRYAEGGHVFVRKSQFILGTGEGVAAAAESTVDLQDCYVDGPLGEVSKRVTFGLVDASQRSVARRPATEPLPLVFRSMEELVRPFYARVDHGTRGPLSGDR